MNRGHCCQGLLARMATALRKVKLISFVRLKSSLVRRYPVSHTLAPGGYESVSNQYLYSGLPCCLLRVFKVFYSYFSTSLSLMQWIITSFSNPSLLLHNIVLVCKAMGPRSQLPTQRLSTMCRFSWVERKIRSRSCRRNQIVHPSQESMRDLNPPRS